MRTKTIQFVLLLFIAFNFSSCKKDQAEEILEEVAQPSANFTFTIEGTYAPITVKFQNLSKNGTTYQWDFGDGSKTIDKENPIHKYLQGGVFTVTLKVLNKSKEHIITKTVNIKKAPVKMAINKLVLRKYPTTCSDGSGWDYVGGPDIYWKLMNYSTTSTYFTSGIINDVNHNQLPLSFTYGLPYTINDLNQTFSFEFFDKDSPDADDNINYSAYCRIKPSSYDTYPSIIHFNNGQMKFDLYVSWINPNGRMKDNGNEITIKSFDKRPFIPLDNEKRKSY